MSLPRRGYDVREKRASDQTEGVSIPGGSRGALGVTEREECRRGGAKGGNQRGRAGVTNPPGRLELFL